MRHYLPTLALASVVLVPAAAFAQAHTATLDAQTIEFFERRIRPILAEHCFSCHGPKRQQAGLRLDSAAALQKGSDGGPILVAGQPDKSLLIKAVRHQGEIKMPPKGKLPPHVIADLEAWIKLGAPWPDTGPSAPTASTDVAAQKHWAFQPIGRSQVPQVKDTAWVRTPIDAFILARLEEKGLAPNPTADPRTLLRRLKFDLLGLPATAEEVAAFEARIASLQKANAFADHGIPHRAVEEIVDRFLASPQFGERWARHWLDVARYADTKGYVFQEERRFAYAYTYRDYVIRSFNDDVPYDRFILEQLAADRLVAAGQADDKALAAMGFLTIGRRFLNNKHDIIDDRIDVVGRGLLGLTVTCARCHDHKYDPIPTKDYYSLYGIFASSEEPKDLPVIASADQSPAFKEFSEKLAELQAEVTRYQQANKAELAAGNRKVRDGLRALQKKVDQFQATSPAAPARAMVLVDAPTPFEPVVFLRGNPNSPGPRVPRQFLQVLAPHERVPFKHGSGRLELARAIASKDNPLTARVLVNRLWLHLFGAGLVSSPSNFGLRSDPPSHPELLDYLARRFMEDGWSVKKALRLMVLARTYQLSSADHAEARALDADNRLLARFNRRRLDLEAMRDALLFVAGKLDLTMFGRPVDLTAGATGRRTIYGFIDRQNLPGFFRTFDFASPDASSPQRFQTTVPQQALFLMNHPFVQEQARVLLKRVDLEGKMPPGQRIQALYRRILARPANADEVSLGLTFVGRPQDPASRMSPWEQYTQVLLLTNEFMFVD